MDDEWEEEEQLVVVELSGIINSDFLTKCKEKCKIVGIDTEQPVMQVGRYVFAGEYEDVLGTCVIFEETAGNDSDPEAKPHLKYKCHTVKKLMMQRTFLSEKKEGEDSTGGIEVLQLTDGEFSGRPKMICSFLSKPKDVMGEKCKTSNTDPSEIRNRSSGSEAEVTDSENMDLSQLGSTASGHGTSTSRLTEEDAETSDQS
ncbi:general transcription factor 3C polypeptide 6 [Amia ocellicauda]|uniref:general transcription factor 3C polypeptide 6 n=1 Tax=Amia ocellicauda TaxID=2972642 RepID=UPI003463CD4E